MPDRQWHEIGRFGGRSGPLGRAGHRGVFRGPEDYALNTKGDIHTYQAPTVYGEPPRSRSQGYALVTMSVTLFANAASRIHLRSRWFIGNASLYSCCLPGIRSRLFPFPRFYDLPFLGISENCRSVFQRLVLSGTPYFSCCIKSWRKRCWYFSSGPPFGGPSVPWGRLLGYPAHRFVDPTVESSHRQD